MVNMTFADTANNLYDVMVGVNNANDGVVFTILLGLIFFAMFAMFKNYETTMAFGAASFVTAIVAGLGWFMGFIAWYLAVIPLVLLVGSMILWTTKG